MSENGLFRKSIGGFNKKDVHNYIDMVLLRHSKEMGEKDNQINELIAQVNSLNTSDERDNKISDLEKLIETKDLALENKEEKIAEINRKADKLYYENKDLLSLVADDKNSSDVILKEEFNDREKELLDEISGLQARLNEATVINAKSQTRAEDFEIFKKREQILVESCNSLREDKESFRDKLHKCQQILAGCEKELEKCKAKVRSNEKMLGNVGAFVMELHSLGNQVLENTAKRSEDSLNSLESAVSNMALYIADAEKTLKTARIELDHHNETSSLRLEELINEMKTDEF